MPAAWDTSKYLGLYVSEAIEHLEALGRDSVKLERGEPDALDAMFRHAHSVKGMASSMSFTETARLAHRLEDLLDALRARGGRPSRAQGDLVLLATDALQAHVRASEAGQALPDSQELVGDLERTLRELGTTPAGHVEAVAEAGKPESPPRYALALRVSPTVAQPGVRAFLAYKRLSTLGNVFQLDPPLEEVKAGQLPQGMLRLTLETPETAEAVTRLVATVSDVELVRLTQVTAAPPPVPTPVPEREAARAEPVGHEALRTVRVKADFLDDFLDATGELLLGTARLKELHKGLPEVFRPPLDEAVDKLHGLVRDLSARVIQARMTPLSLVADRLPRAARDIARRRGREVELAIEGADIELDRSIVEELGDPLLHLLRNAIDHGVEPPEERKMRGKPVRAKVAVRVRRSRDRVVIEVSDDGRGLDVERLKRSAVDRGLLTADDAAALGEKEAFLLACLPGVSTATSVTDISGRGVGMDVVKRVVESVGGSVDIESQRGKGTTFRLTVPLTVALVHLLLVGVGDEVFGLPITKVAAVVWGVHSPALERSGDAPVLPFLSGVVPAQRLSDLLRLPRSPGGTGLSPYAVVEAEEGRVALEVDRLLGQEEVVLKALNRPLDLVLGLAGVTILGNGRPVFILDVGRLHGG